MRMPLLEERGARAVVQADLDATGGPSRRRVVLPVVEDDVAEGAVHLGGGLQGAAMVAVAEQASAPAREGVDRARDAREEHLGVASEASPVRCLEDEVDVVRLDRELEHAHAAGDGRPDLVHDRTPDALCAEIGPERDALDRHVNGMGLDHAMAGRGEASHPSARAIAAGREASARAAPAPHAASPADGAAPRSPRLRAERTARARWPWPCQEGRPGLQIVSSVVPRPTSAPWPS